MAQVTALQPTGLPGPTRTFVAKDAAAAVTWASKGGRLEFAALNHGPATGRTFAVTMRASAGTARAKLYDETDTADVANSEITTASATMVRVASGSITLVEGNEYRAQFGTLAGDDGHAVHAQW